MDATTPAIAPPASTAGRQAMLAAAAALATILCGTMSLTPLVWNDSTTFVSSALATLASGSLQLHAGRGPGYVYLLAAMFKLRETLPGVVLLQQAAWCGSMALVACTIARLLSWRYALLAFVLAAYPGIQYFQNLVLAESFYTSSLTCALCLLLLAARATGWARGTALLLAAIALAATAGLLKIQGLPPFLAIAAGAVWIAWQPMLRKGAVLVTLFAALGAAQLAGSLQSKSQSADAGSALFGSKTLFCIHLDLVLASGTTAALAQQSFGAKSGAVMELLGKDLASKAGEFKTLGFYADACQYDGELDRLGIESIGVAGLNRWYRDAFVSAVAHHPLRYLRKVAVQMAYGLRMSVPPLALGATYGTAPEQQSMVRRMMADAGLPSGLRADEPIAAPVFARTDRTTGAVLRVLSLAMSAALLAALAGLLWAPWRRHPDAALALFAALVWFAQVGGVALTHTLDVWRYIAPVAPAGILALAIGLRIALNLWPLAFRRARRASA